MIAAALGALTVLVGVVAPFERGALQVQGCHRDVSPVLEATLWHRNRNHPARMTNFASANFFIGDAKNKIDCQSFPNPLSAEVPELILECQSMIDVRCRAYSYNVRFPRKYDIVTRVIQEEFPRFIWFTLADRLERVVSYFVFEKELIPEFRLRSNRDRWGVASIFNCKSNIDRQVPIVIDQGSLDSRNDLKPWSLFLSHFRKLPTRGIGLPFGLHCQISQIAYGRFNIGSVGDRTPCQESNRQGAATNEEGQPFADGETAKKIAGWIAMSAATVIGAIGAASLMGAQCGRDFDLSRGERIRYAIFGSILFVIAAWLVAHVAAPMVGS
jgi:hypothetical protein